MVVPAGNSAVILIVWASSLIASGMVRVCNVRIVPKPLTGPLPLALTQQSPWSLTVNVSIIYL